MPEAPFVPFSAPHAFAVATGGAVTLALILLGRRSAKNERRARAILVFLNLVAIPFSLVAWSIVRSGASLDNAVPLHLCDVAAVLAAFALLRAPAPGDSASRSFQLLALLTYFWGLAGTLQGLVTPAISLAFPHPATFAFFLQHFVVVATALYLPLVLRWRSAPSLWRSPLVALAWLNLYLLVAMAANHLLGTNFGFLARKPDNPSLLDHLGPHPIYILWLELIALVFFLLLNLPVRRRGSSK